MKHMKHYSTFDLILMFILTLFGISFSLLGVFRYLETKSCDKACYPDVVQFESCYKDRIVCVGKDKIYVKGR